MVTLNPSANVDLNLTNSSSALNNVNFLQPNTFRMNINRKNYPNLEMFCQSFIHPDASANPADIPYSRVTAIPMSPDKLSFAEMTATIILDENMNSYEEMYNWMERLIQVKEKSAMSISNAANFDSTPGTYADVTLSVLNSTNNLSRQIRYIDAIPTSLGSISFESVSGDQFLTYTVSFRFSYFEIK